jgi:RES domain-containing protein
MPSGIPKDCHNTTAPSGAGFSAVPTITAIDRRNTHRLIPAQFADGGASVLARLADNQSTLNGIFELDNATNDRLLAESRLLPGIDERELVFGIPSYRIINATFCHAAPNGSRFNSSDRGAWYAAFELKTSQIEVAYHKQLWLQETAWDEEEIADYQDYLADFHAEFNDLRDDDLRDSREYVAALAPHSYSASQTLATELLELGSAGIVYPSVRHSGGTCIVCFRPVLVTNVRLGNIFKFIFPDSRTAPIIRRI